MIKVVDSTTSYISITKIAMDQKECIINSGLLVSEEM